MRQPIGHEIVVDGVAYVKVDATFHRLMNPNLFDCDMCALGGKRACRDADCLRYGGKTPFIYVKKLEV